MGALCGPACGWCGRCDAAWEADDKDRVDEDYVPCDVCGCEIGAQPIVTTIGRFCSAACLDDAQAALEWQTDMPENLKGATK